MRTVRWLFVGAYIGLEVVMNRPAYYIFAALDVVSGSTGWHRAIIIDSAVKYLSEWWIVGTDYTRHWAGPGPTPEHTDMTNQYVHMGVLGGLALMFLFIAIFVRAFAMVGERLREASEVAPDKQFIVWGLGSALFAHVVTILSVTYFDQSFVFFYLTLGAIGSARGLTASAVPATGPSRAVPTAAPRWRPKGRGEVTARSGKAFVRRGLHGSPTLRT
jgi:hypothetical protein